MIGLLRNILEEREVELRKLSLLSSITILILLTSGPLLSQQQITRDYVALNCERSALGISEPIIFHIVDGKAKLFDEPDALIEEREGVTGILYEDEPHHREYYERKSSPGEWLRTVVRFGEVEYWDCEDLSEFSEKVGEFAGNHAAGRISRLEAEIEGLKAENEETIRSREKVASARISRLSAENKFLKMQIRELSEKDEITQLKRKIENTENYFTFQVKSLCSEIRENAEAVPANIDNICKSHDS